jgi:hypothetical protein
MSASTIRLQIQTLLSHVGGDGVLKGLVEEVQRGFTVYEATVEGQVSSLVPLPPSFSLRSAPLFVFRSSTQGLSKNKR